MGTTTCRLVSPPGSVGGAIALFELTGEIDAACARLGCASPPVGRFALRRWEGVDEVVVARVSVDMCLICPHAGSAVTARVRGAFERAGILPRERSDVRLAYPEARSLVEARVLDALARAKSPLALDLLAWQPSRWESVERGELGVMSQASSRVLRRLIDPPLIVAAGPPNIGKSSLLNELAGRTVSIVADEPGTTRDHVGVDLELAGLAVRYLDLPGLDQTPGDSSSEPGDAALNEAQSLARELIPKADLVLLCADPRSGFVDLPTDMQASACVRVLLRGDLEREFGHRRGADVVTSVRNGSGIAELVAMVRERLVPGGSLESPLAWTFWDGS